MLQKKQNLFSRLLCGILSLSMVAGNGMTLPAYAQSAEESNCFVGVDDVADVMVGQDFDLRAGVTAIIDGESAAFDITKVDAVDANKEAVEIRIEDGILKNPVSGDTYRIAYDAEGLHAERTIAVPQLFITAEDSLNTYVGIESDLMEGVTAFDSQEREYKVYVSSIQKGNAFINLNERERIGSKFEAVVSPQFTPQEEGTYAVEYVAVDNDGEIAAIQHRNVYATMKSTVRWKGIDAVKVTEGTAVQLADGVSAALDDGTVLDIKVSGLKFNGEEIKAFETVEMKEGTYVATYSAMNGDDLLGTAEKQFTVSKQRTLFRQTQKKGATAINSFGVQFVSGGKLKNGVYLWTAQDSLPGHMFSFRVNYATSGIGETDPFALQIRIPKQILRDKGGTFAGTTKMSVPHRDEVTADDTEHEYVWYEEGNYIVYTNRLQISAAVNGYFEVGYVTSGPTYIYFDMRAMDAFKGTITVKSPEAAGGSLSKESNELKVAINTAVTIIDTDKRYPMMYRTWSPAWGAKPADADKYYYLDWPIVTNINEPTQTYTFTLSDTVTSSYGPVSVVAYEIGTGTYSTNNSIPDQIEDFRCDHVITRHEKAVFDKYTEYRIQNTVKATVIPTDKVDAATSAVSTREYVWTKPVFNPPIGHFEVRKYGNENWHERFEYYWDYASYDLDKMQESKADINDIKYYVEPEGYPYPWTVVGNSNDPNSYGKRKVTYIVEDEEVYLRDPKKIPEQIVPEEDYSKNTTIQNMMRLNAEDYDFSYLTFAPHFQDAVLHTPENARHSFGGKWHIFTTDDVINVSVKVGGNWIDAGSVNLGSNTATIKDSHFKSYTSGRYRIDFSDGVDGYRLTYSNAYFYSCLGVYPYISLKATDRVWKETFEEGGIPKDSNDTGKPKDIIYLENVACMTVKDSNNKVIFDGKRIIGDRIRRSVRDSILTKKAVQSDQDMEDESARISWTAQVKEILLTGTGEETPVKQTSGTFFDLLPQGATLDQNSVKVSKMIGGKSVVMDKGTYSVEVQFDKTGSKRGRQMVIIHMLDQADGYIVNFDTLYSWDAMRDYGTYVLNPIAYETGNEKIAKGYPNNAESLKPTENDKKSDIENYYELRTENYNLMKNLNGDKSNRFIYANGGVELHILTYATAGLKKKVMWEGDAGWSYDTTSIAGTTYMYRLRYANSKVTRTKNMILFDSLENYKPDDASSEWHGTLQSIDTSLLEAAGIKPVVYLSSTANLNLDVAANHDITNTAIWKEKSQFGNIANAKAIAIDMRTARDGSKFILGEGKGVNIVLYFTTPNTVAASSIHKYPETYNNIYIQDTVVDQYNHEKSFYIHQDYTTVRYRLAVPVKIHKVNEEDTSQPVGNISFRLFGTSEYGTKYDEVLTTNKDGDIVFPSIEKGTYSLVETKCSEDWILDSTIHTVQVKALNQISFDGVNKGIQAIVIKNKPRIHGDVEFFKRENGTDRDLEGAKFLLSGKSDYGNEINMVCASGDDGIAGHVIFSNIELGVYTLKEIEAPKAALNVYDYIPMTDDLQVEVDKNGNTVVRRKNSQGNFENVSMNTFGEQNVYNERYHELRLIKIDAYTKEPLGKCKFTLTGVSDYGNRVNKTGISEEGSGIVSFAGLESGTYILKEIEAPEGYKIDSMNHAVRIEMDGTITISGLTQDKDTGYFTVSNKVVPGKKVVVIKKWIDNNSTSRPTPVIHISATKP